MDSCAMIRLCMLLHLRCKGHDVFHSVGMAVDSGFIVSSLRSVLLLLVGHWVKLRVGPLSTGGQCTYSLPTKNVFLILSDHECVSIAEAALSEPVYNR